MVNKIQTATNRLWLHIILGITATLITYSLIDFQVWLIDDNHRTTERLKASHALHLLKNEAEKILHDAIQLNVGIKTYLASLPDRRYIKFNTWAELAIDEIANPNLRKVLRNVGFSPYGILSYVYPLKGNEAALGQNILSEQQKISIIEEPIKNKHKVLAGPQTLIQGGRGLISRYPLFVKDKDGEEAWIGNASVVLDFDALLHTTGIVEFSQNWQLAIRGKDGKGENGEVFFGSAVLFEENNIEETLATSAGEWVFSTKPINGWAQQSAVGKIANYLAPILAIIVGYLTFLATQTGYHLKRSRQFAERASFMKTQFLANMSHEIRTPLSSVIGFSEQALEDDVSDLERQQYLQKIVSSSHHLLELLNNIIDMTKIESGKLDSENIPVLLADLMYSLDTIIAPQANKKDLYFNIEYQHPLPIMFKTDPTRLRQILINLLNNAVKFTHSGRVTLKVHYLQESNRLVFIVEDEGIGLSPEQIDNVFKAFMQADSSTTRKFGGSGLGLSISKHLAEHLGGNLKLKSKLGEGSTFTLTIDAGFDSPQLSNDIPELIQPPESTPHNKPSARHLSGHILIAEDTQHNQELIELLLKQTNIKYSFVENGEQAVTAALHDKDIDLILMDIQMPIMDGIEATRVLRTSGFTKPIISLTANSMKQDQDEQLKAGIDQTLCKPINKNDFFNTLQTYLGSSELDLSHDSNDGQTLNDQELQNIDSSPEFKALIARFKESVPSTIVTLETFFDDNNWQQLAQTAHSLKGSGSMFNQQGLSDAASFLEIAAKDKSSTDCQKYIMQLKAIQL